MSDASKAKGKGGGEAGGARLLHLARRELLDVVLPALGGDERYRARLIANAMKIAGQEFDSGAVFAEETARETSAFADAELGGKAAELRENRQRIREALRAGELDANPALFELLDSFTRRRRALLG